MFALLGLVIGALIALLLQPTVPAELTRYVAMGVLAAIDASVGGVRSYLERTFNDRVFVLAFVTNAAAGAGLVWLGDQLAVDLTTAVAVVFGIRIFQNLAALRRRMFGGGQ
jgi:small basic protein